MRKNIVYKTKQKDIILETIKKEQVEFTVKDIYNELKESVGLTTIYRFIDKLVNEDVLKRFIDKNNVTYYQYLEKCDKSNHFYLKCQYCGETKHVDCDCIEDLFNHISNHHKFKLDKDQIVISGICERCMRK